MQLRALGVTCTKVGLFFPYSQSSTLHAKIIFFSHFSWLVQWMSPKRRDCLLSIMMGVTIYCMHFWLWFCKECFVGLYTCICFHDTLTTRQLGCGCLGQEEHLSINLCQWGFDPVINRENIEQFYRIEFLIPQNISKHFNCKRIMRGRNHVKLDIGIR